MVIQIGGTSVWFCDGTIRCESYSGDVHGSFSFKQTLLSAREISENKIAIKTNKGLGYIQVHPAATGNYTVELVLPKLWGKHRFYGNASGSQVNAVIQYLVSLQ